jgi:hypothetical protein
MKEALTQLKYTTWEAFGGHDDFCIIGSTLIDTPNGPIPITSITNNTEVMTFSPDTLTALSNPAILTGTKEVSRYTFSDATTIEMTSNHPVLTTLGWVPAGKLLPGMQIVKRIECKQNTQERSGLRKLVGIIKVRLNLMMESVNGYINSFGKK